VHAEPVAAPLGCRAAEHRSRGGQRVPDAKLMEIIEGSNEIYQLILARRAWPRIGPALPGNAFWQLI